MIIPETKSIRESLIYKDRRKKIIPSYTETHFERRDEPFELIDVETPYLLKKFGKLRHQVYLEENRLSKEKFTSIQSSVDEIELDEYDDHSKHYLLNFRPLDLFVGGIRLIMPDNKKQFCGVRPFQLCPELEKKIGCENICNSFEISRLLLSKERLKLATDYLKNNNKSLKTSPLLHLFKPVYTAYAQENLRFATLITGKGILKILSQVGFSPITVGPEIEYNGIVQPAYIDLENEYKKFSLKDQKLLDFFSQNTLFTNLHTPLIGKTLETEN